MVDRPQEGKYIRYMRGKECTLFDYSSLFNMCSDALENGKLWLAHQVIQTFIKYPILAVPFVLIILANFKKAVAKLVEALI